MSMGERIRYIRNLRGMTQKQLGMAVGFPEKTADVRIAQYESGTRTPKSDKAAEIANALSVAPQTLAVPDTDSCIALMCLMFALEDNNGLRIDKEYGVCLRVDAEQGKDAAEFHERLCEWYETAELMRSGKISKKEYDDWRYNYVNEEKSLCGQMLQ